MRVLFSLLRVLFGVRGKSLPPRSLFLFGLLSGLNCVIQIDMIRFAAFISVFPLSDGVNVI